MLKNRSWSWCEWLYPLVECLIACFIHSLLRFSQILAKINMRSFIHFSSLIVWLVTRARSLSTLWTKRLVVSIVGWEWSIHLYWWLVLLEPYLEMTRSQVILHFLCYLSFNLWSITLIVVFFFTYCAVVTPLSFFASIFS
jgi:hypothetical protein